MLVLADISGFRSIVLTPRESKRVWIHAPEFPPKRACHFARKKGSQQRRRASVQSASAVLSSNPAGVFPWAITFAWIFAQVFATFVPRLSCEMLARRAAEWNFCTCPTWTANGFADWSAGCSPERVIPRLHPAV